MKNWMVVVPASCGADDIKTMISQTPGVTSVLPPIPLEPDELVFRVTGPDDLPTKLDKRISTRRVFPDSDIELI